MWRRFRHDQGGNVLIITGVMILVLMALAGSSVDLGRQQIVKLKLQQSSDAAALAAALLPPEATDADRRQTALRYFNLNYPTEFLGVARPTPKITIGPTIDVSAQGTVRMHFLSNLGTESLNAVGRSVVANSSSTSQSYDLLLVMDNSNSMAEADVGTTDSRNVPPPQLQAAQDQAISDCKDWYSGFPSSLTSAAYSLCQNGSIQSGISDFTHGKLYYGLIGTSRLNALRFSANALVQQLLVDGTDNRVGAIRWASDVRDTQDLTMDRARLEQFIDGMNAFGGTNSIEGLHKAVTLASGFDHTHVRAVVLLTDGQNTQSAKLGCVSGTNPDGSSNPCAKLDDGTPEHCNGQDFCQRANDLSLPLCDQLKKDGVLVYTVAYGKDAVTGAEAAAAQAFLKQCASRDDYFYTAANAQDLNVAFASIVTQLGKVRLIQ